VKLLGPISEEDKVCLLDLSRAFVFSSDLRSEAFGMSLVEAAMFGKPLVSCEIGTGTSYINLEGVTGWTVPPEDPDALRAAMLKLLQRPDQASAMGAAARDRFEQLFTARQMAAAYQGVYRELLAARTIQAAAF
jgi:glycosyltransferase involved in cell wall biosynthesis